VKTLRPIGFATVLGLLAWAGLAWAPAASAVTSHCLIINAAMNTSYTSLQAAQDAASAGGTLWVRGTCTGTTTISKNLTVTGQQPAGFTPPTLDGRGQGSVLTMRSVTVTINTLTITGGNGTFVPDQDFTGGGGIYIEGGALTLNSTAISDNAVSGPGGSGPGGGIFSLSGSVTLNGTSSISGNTAGSVGGGIHNAGGTVTLNDSATVGDNTAFGGGGITNLDGSVTLNNSATVSDNTASAGGGGITSSATPPFTSASVTLNDTSSISGNTAGGRGGGIANNFSTVTMNGSATISGNTADFDGGGIGNFFGTVTMDANATITRNTTSGNGGGIKNVCGTLNGAVAPPAPAPNVFGNHPDDIVNVCGD